MTAIAAELDDKLKRLDPVAAQRLTDLVRDAIILVEASSTSAKPSSWPAGYFEATAGAFADVEFERPPQPPLTGVVW